MMQLSDINENYSRWLTGIVLVGCCLVFTAAAREKPPVRTLVITGAAPYGYHPWEKNIEVIEPRLEAFGISNPEYHIARGLEDWRKWDGNYNDYDAVIIIYYWSQAPEAELEKLDRYVRNGGGLVVAHSALAGFWNQKIFDRWTGIAYRERDADYGRSLAFDTTGKRIVKPPGEGNGSAHAPIDTFRIHTRTPDHPIMKGLPMEWMQSKDELYYNLRGPDTDIHVLAVAEAPDGTYAPQAWVRKHDKGRIFCLTPGHHEPGASSVGFITLLARGIEWAATAKVTLEVPSNFPTQNKAVTDLPRF